MYWFWRRGQMWHDIFNHVVLCSFLYGTFYMLIISYKALCQFSIKSFNGLLTWPHSTHIQSFTRIHSKFLLSSQTECHANCTKNTTFLAEVIMNYISNFKMLYIKITPYSFDWLFLDKCSDLDPEDYKAIDCMSLYITLVCLVLR